MDIADFPTTVQSETVGKLRSAILSGRFAPGERMVEAALCEMMEVSRTSIREALRRLEGEKLVRIVPNKGPSVAELSWEEAEEIYHVRRILEAEAAGLFTARASKADIAAMRKLLLIFSQAVAEGDSIGRINATSDFYDVILRGCGNRIIFDILQGLKMRINLLRSRSMSRPGRSQSSATELRRILRAIEAGDARKARRAAAAHVAAACAVARDIFGPTAPSKSPAKTPPRSAGIRPRRPRT
jgi:DNA-binding GntR family transcriptional regulator